MSTQGTPLAQTLSPREQDFLRLLAEDRSNAEIAERLVLSTGTVRWYVKQLYAKLGVHSREETVERANALLRAPTPPPHNLPTPATPFIGCKRELAELDALLADPALRLVTILGPGGMGKSRLAIRMGRRVGGADPGRPAQLRVQPLALRRGVRRCCRAWQSAGYCADRATGAGVPGARVTVVRTGDWGKCP